MRQQEPGQWGRWREWSFAIIAAVAILATVLIIGVIMLFRFTFLPVGNRQYYGGLTPNPAIQRSLSPTPSASR